MDMHCRTFHTLFEVEEILDEVLDKAALAARVICDLLAADRSTLFEPVAQPMQLDDEPLRGNRPNFIELIEQLNKTFHLRATFRAVGRLIELHPEVGGFKVSLGSWPKIESIESRLVAADGFYAVHLDTNQLNKRIARLADDPALHRYVFVASPEYAIGRQKQLEEPGTRVQVHAMKPQ